MSRRPERGLGFVTAALLVVAVIAAVVVGHDHRGPDGAGRAVAARPATTSPTTVTTAACPAPASTSSGSLLAGLFISAPNGFVRQPDASVGAGPLGAAKLESVSGQPAVVAQELRNDGFEGAALRVWIDADDDEQAQVTLVEFSCAAGANEYFQNQADHAFGTTGDEAFEVDGLASAKGERSEHPDAKGHYLQVVGVASGSIYEQTATFTPQSDDGSLAGAVSQLQIGALGTV